MGFSLGGKVCFDNSVILAGSGLMRIRIQMTLYSARVVIHEYCEGARKFILMLDFFNRSRYYYGYKVARHMQEGFPGTVDCQRFRASNFVELRKQ